MMRMAIRSSIVLVLSVALAAHANLGTGAARTRINLTHLNFLHTTTPYTALIPNHTTTDPGTPLDTWWVYASYNKANGRYNRTGGGDYHPITNTYGQGAYDTNDSARAAIVCPCHGMGRVDGPGNGHPRPRTCRPDGWSLQQRRSGTAARLYSCHRPTDLTCFDNGARHGSC